MKEIYYDAEGDILTVDFPRLKGKKELGLQITDNIVLYINPSEEKPVHMIFLSYSRLVEYTRRTPLKLDMLASYPKRLQRTALKLIQQPPVSNFLELKTLDSDVYGSVRVKKIALEPKILEEAIFPLPAKSKIERKSKRRTVGVVA
jgi:hypothetical protein